MIGCDVEGEDVGLCFVNMDNRRKQPDTDIDHLIGSAGIYWISIGFLISYIYISV